MSVGIACITQVIVTSTCNELLLRYTGAKTIKRMRIYQVLLIPPPLHLCILG